MQFEYDLAKSKANRLKHGIDFEQAKLLWDDPRAIEIPARIDEEERSSVIGEIDGKVWTAVITYRGASIRIISVRRAREKEERRYEGQ